MKLKKLLAAALISGSLLFSGHSYAADGMTEFRNAYLAAGSYTGVMVNGFDLFGPYFHADVSGKGQLLQDGSLAWEGKLNWVFTSKDSSNSVNENIPMYVEQRGGVMTLYAYRNNRWNKFNLPGIPSNLAKVLRSDDPKVLANNMTVVKDAKVIDDNDKSRKIRVTVDGKKLAAVIGSAQGGATAAQNVVINRLKTALNNADFVVDWDVRKGTNETVTVNANMTPVIRAYGKAVIDEMAAGKIKLSDEDKNYYATLGYYAELPVYLTIIGAGNADRVMTPSGLNAATDNGAVFDDIKKDIATTPTK